MGASTPGSLTSATRSARERAAVTATFADHVLGGVGRGAGGCGRQPVSDVAPSAGTPGAGVFCYRGCRLPAAATGVASVFRAGITAGDAARMRDWSRKPWCVTFCRAAGPRVLARHRGLPRWAGRNACSTGRTATGRCARIVEYLLALHDREALLPRGAAAAVPQAAEPGSGWSRGRRSPDVVDHDPRRPDPERRPRHRGGRYRRPGRSDLARSCCSSVRRIFFGPGETVRPESCTRGSEGTGIRMAFCPSGISGLSGQLLRAQRRPGPGGRGMGSLVWRTTPVDRPRSLPDFIHRPDPPTTSPPRRDRPMESARS